MFTKMGPIAKTTRKFPFAIQDASAASAGDLARVATWNLMVVFVCHRYISSERLKGIKAALQC